MSILRDLTGRNRAEKQFSPVHAVLQEFFVRRARSEPDWRSLALTGP